MFNLQMAAQAAPAAAPATPSTAATSAAAQSAASAAAPSAPFTFGGGGGFTSKLAAAAAAAGSGESLLSKIGAAPGPTASAASSPVGKIVPGQGAQAKAGLVFSDIMSATAAVKQQFSEKIDSDSAAARAEEQQRDMGSLSSFEADRAFVLARAKQPSADELEQRWLAKAQIVTTVDTSKPPTAAAIFYPFHKWQRIRIRDRQSSDITAYTAYKTECETNWLTHKTKWDEEARLSGRTDEEEREFREEMAREARVQRMRLIMQMPPAERQKVMAQDAAEEAKRLAEEAREQEAAALDAVMEQEELEDAARRAGPIVVTEEEALELGPGRDEDEFLSPEFAAYSAPVAEIADSSDAAAQPDPYAEPSAEEPSALVEQPAQPSSPTERWYSYLPEKRRSDPMWSPQAAPLPVMTGAEQSTLPLQPVEERIARLRQLRASVLTLERADAERLKELKRLLHNFRQWPHEYVHACHAAIVHVREHDSAVAAEAARQLQMLSDSLQDSERMVAAGGPLPDVRAAPDAVHAALPRLTSEVSALRTKYQNLTLSDWWARVDSEMTAEAAEAVRVKEAAEKAAVQEWRNAFEQKRQDEEDEEDDEYDEDEEDDESGPGQLNHSQRQRLVNELARREASRKVVDRSYDADDRVDAAEDDMDEKAEYTAWESTLKIPARIAADPEQVKEWKQEKWDDELERRRQDRLEEREFDMDEYDEDEESEGMDDRVNRAMDERRREFDDDYEEAVERKSKRSDAGNAMDHFGYAAPTFGSRTAGAPTKDFSAALGKEYAGAGGADYSARELKRRTDPNVTVYPIQTLSSIAGSMEVPLSELTKKLKELDLTARGSTGLVKEDVARLLIEEFGFTPVKPATIQPQEVANLRRKSLKSDEYLALPLRAPVICVMGHVDHGKTTLLDRLRSENRAAAEAGGITQSIGAFRVDLGTGESAGSGDVQSSDGSERPTFATFLDTPGHAAFKNMRAKGASSSCTDLIILVISAVDGLMPQTLEVIQLARKHNVPLIVAINKCDVAGADPKAVQQALFVHDVVVEDMGGEVLSCNISAKTGEGIDQLKELVAVTGEVLQLHASREVPAEAYIIESRVHKKGGCVATVLVRNGSLRVGQHFVCGLQSGRIRSLHDENDRSLSRPVYPGESVQLFGLKSLEDLTEDLYVVESEELAERILAERIALLEIDESDLLGSVQEQTQMDQKAQAYKIQVTRRRQRVAIRPLTEEEKEAKALVDAAVPVVVKADVSGSLEVLLDYFSKLPRDEVICSILKSGLGEISAADVQYAAQMDGGGAAIVGFNVKPSAEAALLAKQLNIRIFTHPVIYTLWDDIRALLSERLPTEMEDSVIGQATVAQLFPLSDNKEKKRKAKAKASAAPTLVPTVPTPEEAAAAEAAAAQLDAAPVVAGCRVRAGKLDSKMLFRLKRDDEIVLEQAECVSLRIARDVKPTVDKGQECGLRLGGHFDAVVKIGDVIECFTKVKKVKMLDDSLARGFMEDDGSGNVHQQAASYE